MQAKLSSSFSNRSLTLKLLKTSVFYSLPAHLSPLTQISTSPSKKLHRSLGCLQYSPVGQATHAKFRKRASWRTLLYWTSYIQSSFHWFQSIFASVYNLSWSSTVKCYKITITVKPFSALIPFPPHITSTNNPPGDYLYSLSMILSTATSSPPGLSTKGHLNVVTSSSPTMGKKKLMLLWLCHVPFSGLQFFILGTLLLTNLI